MLKSRKKLSKEDITYIEANMCTSTTGELAEHIGWNHNTLRARIRKLYGTGKTHTVKCKICEVEFSTRYKQYYCSDNCRKVAESEAAKIKYVTPEKKYSAYISSAKVRGHSFNLTYHEFMVYWGSDCTYCGDPIETIGLDRQDNNKGYSLDNVVPCCGICNKMKGTLSSKEFLDHIDKIGRQV